MPPIRLYAELADWWPLFSHPERYADEAAWILRALTETLGRPPGAVLELGSGGGNNASHLSRHVRMTLVDLSTAMLDVSQRLNPGVEHAVGDMRTVRLGRTFDAVLIHDAIMYMLTEGDLLAALATAQAHLAEGGALIVLPDYVADTFAPRVETDGRDATDESGRGLRYIAWTHEPAAGATTHDVDFVILLRGAGGSVEVVHDRHQLGLFARAQWNDAFVRAGFAPPDIRRDPWQRDVFIARPAVA